LANTANPPARSERLTISTTPRAPVGPILPLVASSVGTDQLLGRPELRPAVVDALAASVSEARCADTTRRRRGRFCLAARDSLRCTPIAARWGRDMRATRRGEVQLYSPPRLSELFPHDVIDECTMKIVWLITMPSLDFSK
jgi:hypothetical protein